MPSVTTSDIDYMAAALEANNDIAADVYATKEVNAVLTTLTLAISGPFPGTKTATVRSGANIVVTRTLTVDTGVNQEVVTVLTKPTSTTFTAVFTKAHLEDAPVESAGTGVFMPPDLSNDEPVNRTTPVWIDVTPEPPVSQFQRGNYLNELSLGPQEYRYSELPLSFLQYPFADRIDLGWQILFADGLRGAAPDGRHLLTVVRLPRSESQRLVLAIDAAEELGVGL